MNNEYNFTNDNIAYQKSKQYGIEIIQRCQQIMRQKRDYTIIGPICNQVVRSSTSISANLAEGSSNLISRKDRINKFLISLKELKRNPFLD